MVSTTVYYVPSKNQFYVQHDSVSSSTHTYYGPFSGDPKDVLGLSESDVHPITSEPGHEADVLNVP